MWMKLRPFHLIVSAALCTNVSAGYNMFCSKGTTISGKREFVPGVWMVGE